MRYSIDFDPSSNLSDTEVDKRIQTFKEWFETVKSTVEWCKGCREKNHQFSFAPYIRIGILTIDRPPADGIMADLIAPKLYSLGAQIRVQIDGRFFVIQMVDNI